MSQRGAFIVIEGLDRSGKTTQVQLLKDELSKLGKDVQLLRFPDRTTTIGQMINQYLQSKSTLDDHVIHLLFSANRWELSSHINTLLSAGTSIVCDRYTYSGMVYSAAKLDPGLSLQWAREPDVGLPRPDLVVFLDLKPEEAARRGGWGDELYEKAEMQREVRRLFLSLTDAAAAGGEGTEERDDMVVLDAGGTVEEVGAQILQVVVARLEDTDNLLGEVRKIGKWPSNGSN